MQSGLLILLHQSQERVTGLENRVRRGEEPPVSTQNGDNVRITR